MALEYELNSLHGVDCWWMSDAVHMCVREAGID